eukprot:GHVS01037294.1.p1 GENE.GHVS01037294.1~~GHVS01037294.1.p1  ORF type:complete len:104 (-),score=5.24 GHVS01037294.1:1020-1331(-)
MRTCICTYMQQENANVQYIVAFAHIYMYMYIYGYTQTVYIHAACPPSNTKPLCIKGSDYHHISPQLQLRQHAQSDSRHKHVHKDKYTYLCIEENITVLTTYTA